MAQLPQQILLVLPDEFSPCCLRDGAVNKVDPGTLWPTIRRVEALPLLPELAHSPVFSILAGNAAGPLVAGYPKATPFLTARVVSTLLVAAALPVACLTDEVCARTPSPGRLTEGDKKAAALRFLEPWLKEGGVTLDHAKDARLCVAYLLETAGRLVKDPANRKAVRAAVMDVAAAAALVETRQGIDALVTGMRYTVMVSPAAKLYVALLGAMPEAVRGGARISRSVCSRVPEMGATESVFVLVQRLGETAQAPFEEVFSRAVWGEARPCLRAAVVFCLAREWSQVWTAMRLPTSRRARQGLATLAKAKWTITGEDFTRLIRFAR